MFLRVYYNDDIVINIKHHFCKDEKLFELFCIKVDFAKYFEKRHSFFKYFVSNIIVILRNELFLYYRSNEITLCCIILRNAFLAPE